MGTEKEKESRQGAGMATAKEWPTRKQVAKELGISQTTVRRMEASKELHPVDIDGVHRFDPEEVAARKRKGKPLEASRDGELASQAFQLFQAGKRVIDVVIELRRPPNEIGTLYEEYRRHHEPDLIIPARIVAELAYNFDLAKEGDVYTAEDIVRLIQALENNEVRENERADTEMKRRKTAELKVKKLRLKLKRRP